MVTYIKIFGISWRWTYEYGKLIGSLLKNLNNDLYDGDEEENSDIHYELDDDENEENKIPLTSSETSHFLKMIYLELFSYENFSECTFGNITFSRNIK